VAGAACEQLLEYAFHMCRWSAPISPPGPRMGPERPQLKGQGLPDRASAYKVWGKGLRLSPQDSKITL
jgi:hypothetical protein